MSRLEHYKSLAEALTKHGKEKRWEVEEIQTIDYSGVEIQVGPFIKAEFQLGGWEEIFYWQEKSDDEFVIYMSVDNWDSWGTHYGHFGNHFYVGKIVKYVPIIEDCY